MQSSGIRLATLILAVLMLPAWPFPTVPGLQSSSFGGGLQEVVISFPSGGGTNSTLNLTIPAGATVISALMNITGLPQVSAGSLDYSTPEKLRTAPSSRNLTFDEQGARLSSFNWSRVQTTDAEFRTDEGANISVGNGVRISDAITGGVSHSFTAVSGVNLTGMPSVNCTPNGEILIAWMERNASNGGAPEACFRRFDASGNNIGPKINQFSGSGINPPIQRAVSDFFGRAIFIYNEFGYVQALVFDPSGNRIGSMITIDFGENGSAVVTGPDEMFVSWSWPSTGRQNGRWYHLNGTPIGNEIILESKSSNPQRTGIVSVGDDRSIASASTDFNSTDGHARAYVLRRDSTGVLLHDRVYVGANDSFTTPTSFAILDDGTSAVAFTADYAGHDLEVRCARVASNGTINGQFMLANASGTNFFAPSLCRLPGNRFACAWGRSSGGSAIDLEGRVFRADGTPEGAVFSMGSASGANASWELSARGNSSLALVVRSDNPAPYGTIRVEAVDLQRALTGHIDTGMLDRPGTVIAEVRQAANTSYSVDILDAETRNVTVSGLHNGDPVKSWTPYILRLNLQRNGFNASRPEPVARSFGVATSIRDFFEEKDIVSSLYCVTVGQGKAAPADLQKNGTLLSTGIPLPYKATSLDNFSWQGDASILPFLKSGSDGIWSDWEIVQSNPDNALLSPSGNAVQWRLELASPAGLQRSLSSVALGYSLAHKTGFLLSAPVNISDGGFTSVCVNWTGDGAIRALVTTDGGMTYDSAPNGLWTPAGGNGRALGAMLFLEGDGNSSPVLSAFNVDYEAQSRPSGIELEIDQSYRWSPPENAPLESGVEVRDFSTALNAVISRIGGELNITIPLNFTSRSAGLLKVNGLRLTLNYPPVIESSSPEADPTVEEGTAQRFELRASDPDGDPLVINWTVEGVLAGSGPSFDFTAPDSEGNITVRAVVSDGHASTVRAWNVQVIFIDRNRPPQITERFPAWDPVINETGMLNFSVRASDPDGQPLRYSWYMDGEKVSVSDNLTYRTWYNSSGAHNVSVTVSDGALSISTRWNVTVVDHDRPPVIMGWWPDNVVSARPGTLHLFGVNATDPDGDPLVNSWWVDGLKMENETYLNFSLVTLWADGRVHHVKVEVSDSNLTVSHEWNIRSIIPGDDTGLVLAEPWCMTLLGIVIPITMAAAAIKYVRDRRAKQQQSTDSGATSAKNPSEDNPK